MLHETFQVIHYKWERDLVKRKNHPRRHPIAMEMYALGLMPLLTSVISNKIENVIHVAFTDDLTGVGKRHPLRIVVKCFALWSLPWLRHKRIEIMADNEGRIQYIEIANETLQPYKKKTTTIGHRHLGTVVGSNEMRVKEEFVIAKVSQFVK